MKKTSLFVGQKTFYERVKESKILYSIAGDSSTSIDLILAAILGNIPDETLTALTALPLVELLNLSKEELLTYPGIGQVNANRMMAAFALVRKLSQASCTYPEMINSPDDVFNLLKDEVKLLDREHLIAIYLNTKHRVIDKEVVSIGTLDSSEVHPREIFKGAIRRSAAAVIVVHNHPSGDPSPSPSDIKVTKVLVEAGKLIGIEVLDHCIIGFNKYVSLKSKGII